MNLKTPIGLILCALFFAFCSKSSGQQHKLINLGCATMKIPANWEIGTKGPLSTYIFAGSDTIEWSSQSYIGFNYDMLPPICFLEIDSQNRTTNAKEYEECIRIQDSLALAEKLYGFEQDTVHFAGKKMELTTPNTIGNSHTALIYPLFEIEDETNCHFWISGYKLSPDTHASLLKAFQTIRFRESGQEQ